MIAAELAIFQHLDNHKNCTWYGYAYTISTSPVDTFCKLSGQLEVKEWSQQFLKPPLHAYLIYHLH